MSASSAPMVPGWYPTPSGDGQLQYFDGQAWTQRFEPDPNAINGPASSSGLPVFSFDGEAGGYFRVSVLALIITVLSLGLAYPFAMVMREKWKAKHTSVDGRRLEFTGIGKDLLGRWIKWLLLTIITLGIYRWWVVPQLTKWKTENLQYR